MRPIDADALKEMKFSGGMHDDNWIVYVPLREVVENIDKAPTVGGWISVKDRLPEKGQEILTYWNWHGKTSEGTEISICNYGGYDGDWYDLGYDMYLNREGYSSVTHWMPLPEPPQERSAT